LLASFDLIHTANRQTVTNHNAIRFRVAAWKAGSAVGEFEVSQFSQILQIQPAAIAGAGARIDRRGFHISMSDRLRHQRNRRAVVERMADMNMSKPVPFRTASRVLGHPGGTFERKLTIPTNHPRHLSPRALSWQDRVQILMRLGMKTFQINAYQILATGLAVTTVAMVAPAQAETLSGTWSGSGYVQSANGQRERVRCRVTYDPQGSKVVGVRANCASSGNSIRQTGELLRIRPGYYAGDFYNRQFDIGGRIHVTVRGSTQTVTFRSSAVRGRLRLRK
jgi:hypothetical protein